MSNQQRKVPHLLETGSPRDYLLGHQVSERERLRFQDHVWEPETEQLLDRLGLQDGHRVLEIGSGLGLALPRFARRVGASGEVLALEQSTAYVLESRQLIEHSRLKNVRVIERSVLDEPLPSGPFNVIYARWVFSFLPDVRSLLLRLRKLLAPGGVLAIVDYNHDGMRLFPRAPALDRVIEAFRRWYAEAGGDLWIAGHLTGQLHASGYHCEALRPHQKAGPPGSPAYQWIEHFLREHGPALVRAELLADEEWQRFIAEWEACRLDPATVVFTPIVVDVIARPA